MAGQMITYAQVAKVIVEIAVAKLGSDLGGHSVVDLVLDNIECISVADAKTVLVMAGVDDILSDSQVVRYSK